MHSCPSASWIKLEYLSKSSLCSVFPTWWRQSNRLYSLLWWLRENTYSALLKAKDCGVSIFLLLTYSVSRFLWHFWFGTTRSALKNNWLSKTIWCRNKRCTSPQWLLINWSGQGNFNLEEWALKKTCWSKQKKKTIVLTSISSLELKRLLKKMIWYSLGTLGP